MNSTHKLSSFLQNLPSFRGKNRVGRTIIKLTGLSGQEEFVINTRAGKLLLPNLRDSISLDLFIHGFYEKGLVDMLIEQLPPGGVLIDVGANIGSVSIPVAKARRDVKIIAVEASPWIYRYLKKNVELNNSENITPLNFAVYHQSGQSLPMYAPRDLFGKGSLKAIYTSDGETVETITIDDLKLKFGFPAIHFMKVDVEGFEASVFRGMCRTAGADRPKIVFEFSEWAETEAGFTAGEAQRELLSMGYQLQDLDENFAVTGEPSTSISTSKNANLLAN